MYGTSAMKHNPMKLLSGINAMESILFSKEQYLKGQSIIFFNIGSQHSRVPSKMVRVTIFKFPAKMTADCNTVTECLFVSHLLLVLLTSCLVVISLTVLGILVPNGFDQCCII